ncbi:MAG: ABC transporter ATP-binding protein [Egibacteraceae bacterium]
MPRSSPPSEDGGPQRSSTTPGILGTAPTANRLLLQAVRRAPLWAAVIALTTLAGAVTALLLPAVMAGAVDAALGRGPSGVALARLAAVLAAAALVELLGGLAGAFYSTSVTAWLRHRLLGHVLTLGVGGQRRFSAGDVLTRLTGDVPGSGNVLPALFAAVVSIATAAGAVVALWLIDWRVAVAFLLGLPPTIALVRVFVMRSSDLFVAYRRLQAAIGARLVDALAGIRTIRASGTAAQEIDRILVPVPELGRTGRAIWHAQRQLAWQAGLLVPLLEVIVIAVAGFGVAAGRVTPGQLLAAFGYVRIALSLFDQIDTLVAFVQARTGATRVAEVLLAQPLPRPPTRPLPDGPGALAFRGVTVRVGERVLLDQLDLEVPAGASIALVGRSGAGKTTLASLVGRLIDPDEGQVLLDGTPVQLIAPGQLHDAVAYAFERPTLLGSSVHDAIAYGRPSSSRADVQWAARAAQAEVFIGRLPQRYDTPLAQAPLSGGETQRLGLARAIAQGGRVLVLDDATSSLDTATERQVQTALAMLPEGRTCLVVAHRATTAARADLVAWLDSGRIRAVGPHAALWNDLEYRAVFAASPAPVTAAARQGLGI